MRRRDYRTQVLYDYGLTKAEAWSLSKITFNDLLQAPYMRQLLKYRSNELAQYYGQYGQSASRRLYNHRFNVYLHDLGILRLRGKQAIPTINRKDYLAWLRAEYRRGKPDWQSPSVKRNKKSKRWRRKEYHD